MKQRLSSILEVMRALSDEHRIRALMALSCGELCVCQIIQLLQLAPSTVSKHMSILKQAGLVQSRKRGRWVHFRLPDSAGKDPDQRIQQTVTELLADDPDIRRDRATMEKIRGMDPEVLCRNQRCRKEESR